MRSIEVEHVTKRYRLGEQWRPTLREGLSLRRSRNRADRSEREFWALRGVSFAVEQGEALGLIGRNGAGKTTLLKMLARITEPTTGVARMRGRVGALLEVGTGFHLELSGRDNIYLNGGILGMKRSEIRKRFDDIVDFAGVEKFIDTPLKRYSSGMYLRLAFAVAAHVEPDIVVVDEVLAVGDANFQRKCLGKMSEFARQGRTVVFVSHDLGAIAQMCRRAIWLDGGKIQHDGTASRSIELYLEARGGQTSQVEFPVDAEKEVQLLAVGLADESGAPIDAPARDKPFAVRVCFRVSERVGGVDVGVYLVTRRGVRVLDENWSDQVQGVAPADGTGVWDVSVLIPPLLAAADYVVGVSMASPYQTFVDEEVLSFRLWPRPDDRRELIERNRVVQPAVEWRLESHAPLDAAF
jgi:ABC-2 type transport system ATP-binding protein/lipopolysaccharide transport system ATP-binding protein